MNIIRIGDLLENNQNHDRPMLATKYLARRVFNPHGPDSEDIQDYFIQSSPLVETTPYAELLPEGTPRLGEYEALILNKIMNPQRPLLVILGQMGSGKSTVKDYVAMHLVRNRKKCDKCATPYQRLISQIDFNNLIYLNNQPDQNINVEVYRILCDELAARLLLDSRINVEEEVVNFWEYEIGLYREQESASMSFRYILSRLSKKYLTVTSFDSDLINARLELLKEIKAHGELYLDYLIRLWKYVVRTKYCGLGGCSFIVLDNLDALYPIVQRKIVDIIHTHVRIGGPLFILLVRPETFDIAGLGTGIIDVEEHHGPNMIEVLLSRMNEFLNNPNQYYDLNGGLTPEQFGLIVRHTEHINKIITNDPDQVFQRFIENTCGNSTRAALVVVQNLFLISKAQLEEGASLTSCDLVRLSICGEYPNLNWDVNSPIEHLFRVSTTEISGLLLKPRILSYFNTSARSRRKVYEVKSMMVSFGFEETLVIDAINDMMNIKHQLIRSNGFDYYDVDALRKYGGDNLRLTNIGKGYADYLLTDLNYFYEIMLDTYVDKSRFPVIDGVNFIRKKFLMILQFLDEIRRIDLEETIKFIDERSLSSYRESFGDALISQKIIKGVASNSIHKITNTSLNDDFDGGGLVGRFRSLILRSDSDADRLLRPK